MVIKVRGVILWIKMGLKGWSSVNSNLRGDFVQSVVFKGWFSAIWPRLKYHSYKKKRKKKRMSL